MGLPGDVVTTTVTGTAVRADGSAAAGAVVAFSMPLWLTDTTSHAAIIPRVFTAVANSSGVWSVAVIATDQAQISPLNWAYTFTVNDNGVMSDPVTVQVPHTPNPTTFDALVPTNVAIGSPNLYVPLAQKAAVGGVATLGNDGKVPSSQLPASSGGTAVSSVTAGDSTITISGTATDPTVKVASNAGLLKTQLASSVQTSLSLADTSLQAAPADRYLTPFGAHSSNVPLSSINAKSTINNEAWFGQVIVRAGAPLAFAKALRSAATATHNITGNNGFAIWNASASSLLWSSASDDLMWETTGVVSKAVTGIATPSADTTFWMAVSCRGYSVAPEFGFVNLASTGTFGDFFARYKGGGYTAWPSSFNPATDLTSGTGFILPLMIG